jgi:hypothetical protein
MSDRSATANQRSLGLSSGSLPDADAGALLETVGRLGLDSVDLRWGKGHRWEPDGLAPFEAAGIRVVFLGVSVVLGADRPLDALRDWAAVLDGRRLPLKVFASAELDGDDATAWHRAEEQIAALTRCSGVAPLVETHHGYAGLPALESLCSRLGCRAVLDIGGFFRLTGGFGDPVGLVAQHVAAAQVKGFRVDDPGRHRALDELPDEAWQLLGTVRADVPVLIETKSGTLAGDAAALRRWSERTPAGRH